VSHRVWFVLTLLVASAVAALACVLTLEVIAYLTS